MHKAILAGSFIALVGCSLFGGGKQADPMAGWGGVWVGDYTGDMGAVGYLEIQIATDSLGSVAGLARFDSGGGRMEAPLSSLVLTADSITTKILFDGAEATVEGSRTEDAAAGTYVVRPEGAEDIIDSGTWELARVPAESGN